MLIRGRVFSPAEQLLLQPGDNGFQTYFAHDSRHGQSSHTDRRARQSGRAHRRKAALRAVASLELAKGLVVLLLGFGAVSLVHKDAWDVAETVLHFLHVNPDHHHYAQVFLNLADNVTDRKLWAVAGGCGRLLHRPLR